ncbi:MAG: type II restriction endonuclease subunit M, partial [Fibrobacter sp.]|nr:type II restriction endonuclease subunit M [Fibrobacter sp.]
MAVLTQQQRNTLESAVKQARRVSEAGAWNALRAFAVDNPEPFPHMNPEQRGLRNRLRSKARLLGDELPSSGHQHIDQLTYELAYEYWHKMLFAKFLEANGLLMHPDGVAVTMDECEELAKEEGYSDKWDIAANFASKMLPAIFRPEDPLMQISFSPDDRIKLEEILEGLDNYIFTADDALGWVYQFWQSEAKDAINKSGDKIDGKKLPAVTQLFTEPYMVHFLIDNTIGAWWVSRNPGVKPPVKFEYLRFLEDGTPAAGKFEGWPDRTSEITTMDPCMGSGHFVVSLFNILVNLRMHEEGLTKEVATDRVIAENLHGLEIDPRCTQIAAFNLALKAWKFCGRYKELPEMNLACSGLAPKGKVENWVKLVGKISDPVQKTRLENGMRALYAHFQMAPELGSLIDPKTIKSDAFTASFEDLLPILAKALNDEADKDVVERGVIAAGIAKAGQILSNKYILQITNVPYLSRGKQDTHLADYCLKFYPDSKGDLATVFLDRMVETSHKYGNIVSVLPQNWLFMQTYKQFRVKLFKKISWTLISRLGPGAFSQISGEVVKAILAIFKNEIPNEFNKISTLDVSNQNNILEKINDLTNSPIEVINQLDQLNNPESKFIVSQNDLDSHLPLLKLHVDSFQGIKTGDDNKFKFVFWEVNDYDLWKLTYGGPISDCNEGCHYVLNWKLKGRDFARYQGQAAFEKDGFYLTNVGSLRTCLFNAKPFTSEITVIIPKNYRDIVPIYTYLVSESYETNLRRIDQNLAISTASVSQVPFDLEYWKKTANELFPNGINKPFSSNPTQWIFHGQPVKSDNPLQVAIGRLLGYRWPAEYGSEMELSDEAKELIKEIRKFDHLSDNDGIICIPAINKEETAANRLRDYLKEVFGERWNSNTIQQLLEKENVKSSNLE